MGIYYRVVNLDKHEVLDPPNGAIKQGPWNHPANLNANVVLWAIWTRWSGDRIAVFDDCGGGSDFYENCRGWPNVWAEVAAGHARLFGGEKTIELEKLRTKVEFLERMLASDRAALAAAEAGSK